MSNLKYSICKGEPWAFSKEPVEQNCIFVNIEDKVNESINTAYSIYVPTDGELTGLTTGEGEYYVTVTPKHAPVGSLKTVIMFEYVSV